MPKRAQSGDVVAGATLGERRAPGGVPVSQLDGSLLATRSGGRLDGTAAEAVFGADGHGDDGDMMDGVGRRRDV